MAKKSEGELINGDYAATKNIIAHCCFSRHWGYLTKALIKSHRCLAKNCRHFTKLRPEYWEALQESKQEDVQDIRAERKAAKKQIEERDSLIKETLQSSGHIFVTKVREEEQGALLVVYYIFDINVDLSDEVKMLQKKLVTAIKLQPRTGAEESIELLIRKPRRETGKVTDLLKAPKVGNATKDRLRALGVFCLEDLLGRSGDQLYSLDCSINGAVSPRYLAAYRSAAAFAADTAAARLAERNL